MSDESIFAEALAMSDPATRAAYLDRACGNDLQTRREVESLLAAHGNVNLLDRPHVTAVETATRLDAGSLPSAGEPGAGELVAGRYRLGALLGQGGMGSVYQAEQELPVRRAVAVKFIRPGLDTDRVLAGSRPSGRRWP